MKTSRAVFSEVQKKAGPFPFNVRVLEDEKRARMGLQEAVQHSLVKPYDVVHSWWLPQLGGKIQAIPGRTNHIWFKADRAGTYYGQCAELCGLYHEAMKARVIVTDAAGYGTFISVTASSTLGKAEFQGGCATCHGMQGQG